jgi:mannose-1-phosphate guanylyltransferase
VSPLVPYDHIYVVTEATHADDLREQLPEIPPANVLVEPLRRGTAAAVGLAATVIAHRDPEATMVSLHSDHAVERPQEFCSVVGAAFAVAESAPWLVTTGVRPSEAHTGLGYIEPGAQLGEFEGYGARRVVRFVEKPDAATAQRFVRDGYLWNPGYFIWRVDVILNEFARLLPEIHQPLGDVARALDTADQGRVLAEAYARMPVETIDYGIMERADRIATVPGDFGWTDIGSWRVLLDIAPKDEAGNVVQGDHVTLNTRQTLLYGSSKPIFALGLDGIIVVDTPDALLVCRADQAERVKDLVERLQSEPTRQGLI